MGCIETCQNDEQDMEVARLTLTWDVLKLILTFLLTTSTVRLTLTWDVLKHLLVPYVPPQKVD